MKKLVTAVCCACVVGAAGLSAAQADKMGKMDKMEKGMKSMTVTGCVAEGTGGHYMLNNAMMPGMKGDAKSYDLMGGDLKAHVGHKVEVTGSMDGKKMDKDKMGKMEKDKMDKDKMGMAKHDVLNVKSVKMLASTCP